jgi:hypothetical protein
MTNTEKKLRKAGWGEEIDNGHITILSTRSVRVFIPDPMWSPEKTDGLKDEIVKVLNTKSTTWGGFKTAGGWWYLEKNYDAEPLRAAWRDQLGPAYYS